MTISIRVENHPFRGHDEFYAIIDDLYDGADKRPIAGMGSTEAEAIADLMLAFEDEPPGFTEALIAWCAEGDGWRRAVAVSSALKRREHEENL